MISREEELKLFDDGIKNPNGYRKHIPFLIEKIITAFIAIFVSICCFISILDKKGIYTWNTLYKQIGIIDGVEKVDSDFVIYYLDVGQGDCSIVISKGKVMMIDTAVAHRYVNIREALMCLEIDTIDYMIITHQHDDHMGSAAKIIENYNVKNLIMPKLSSINMVTNETYKNLLLTIKDYNVNAIAATAGYNFMLGNASVEIISPSEQCKKLNNMSAVTKITYGDTSFLFQGDAEREIENKLLKSDNDLSADIIKLGHHGSVTSSTTKYLKAVNPQIAIISCGEDNTYGHPAGEVIDRLEKYKIDYYLTPYHGNITAQSDGNNIIITTEKKEVNKEYEK